MRCQFRHVVACATCAAAFLAISLIGRPVHAADSTPPRPNILIIVGDDMGFADLSCYGSRNPHAESRCGSGARRLQFTQFYNTGRCCPTRAALLTGLYSHEAGVGHMTDDRHLPGYSGHLNDHCVTFGRVMHDAGYFTALSGKWHVGQDFGVVPSNRGFDRSLNSPAGGFYYPNRNGNQLYLDGKHIESDDPRLPKNWYTTDLFTDWGIKFIDEGRAAKKPWLLYLAYNAPHFPLEAPQEEIAKFRGKYKMGWDEMRLQRHAKQIELGLLDKEWALSPRPDKVKAWDSLSPEQKDRFDHIMAIYAACIAHMDTAVGRLVAALKERWRTGQHADPLHERQRRECRERPKRPA